MLILHPFMKEMKKTAFFICIIMLTACMPHPKKQDAASASLSAMDAKSPFLYFKEDTYDAGKINQGEKVIHTFVLENKGKGDLILNSVTASCGCTVAKWDNKPVAPGKTAEIEVTFNSANRFGTQHKNITVKSNAVPDTKMLTLKCEVVLPNH